MKFSLWTLSSLLLSAHLGSGERLAEKLPIDAQEHRHLAKCADFTAADTSGLGTFSSVTLQARCSGGSVSQIPSTVNFIFTEDSSVTAPTISMTPAGVFTPIVESGSLGFVVSSWSGSGDVG